MPSSRRVVVIAGPNGAGKTTFALRYLRQFTHERHFINADLIAAGLAPLAPRQAAVAAGRLVLAEIDRLSAAGESFAFESTKSGRSYAERLQAMRERGYRVWIVYLTLSSARLSVRRIQLRVRNGGHFVPEKDALRRFRRSAQNFFRCYRQLADAWMMFDNSGSEPRIIARCESSETNILDPRHYRALERLGNEEVSD